MKNKIEKQTIAQDMLNVASRCNNILYKSMYLKHGHYKECDINQHFTSFENACRELNIVCPEDPHDLNAVLDDIRYVLNDQKAISPTIYEENGIYTVESLKNKYGDIEYLITLVTGSKKTEKPKKNKLSYMYPIRPRKSMGKHVMLRWIRR